MKYYRIDNQYIGGTDGKLPEGAVEVPFPPNDARQPWNGSGWDDLPAPEPEPDYDAELVANIEAATTIAGLKAALIGNITGAKARVGGKPK